MAGIIAELNRRNVTRVGIAYAVAGWLITEVGSVVLPTFRAPEWVLQVLIALLVIGFPLVLIFAWVYELTPEGLKKESEIHPDESITSHTARKLNLVVIALLVVAIALFAVDRFAPMQSQSASPGPGQRVSPGNAPSVAVLAFENMSADAENEYFADGISEEILNLLADVRGMSVASRTSAFAFRGKDLPIPEIARALNVRYVLEGSVRKAGQQVRVTAQLIDAESDRHLWSNTYDRTLEDIFAIQDDIAAAIGEALQVRLLGGEGTEVKAQALDPEVYSWFLEARYLLRRRGEADMQAGNKLLIEVVAAEPRFARAHALLGEAYLLNNDDGALVARDVAQSLASMHAAIARSLDPSLAGIDLILGNIAQISNRPLAALRHYDRAIELEPSEPRPYHWRGLLYSQLGYTRQCAEDLEKTRELDPDNPNVHYAYASCMLADDRFEAAIAAASRGPELGNPGGYTLTIHAEMMRGDREAALAQLRHHGAEYAESDEIWPLLLDVLENRAQLKGLGKEQLEALNSYHLLLLEDYQRVLDRLNGADRMQATRSLVWASHHAPLRQDPRFIAAQDRFGALEVWRALGPPPACRIQGSGFFCD